LHRDLKLENLMLTKNESSLRVIDFGLAHQYPMQEDGKTPQVKKESLWGGKRLSSGLCDGGVRREGGIEVELAHQYSMQDDGKTPQVRMGTSARGIEFGLASLPFHPLTFFFHHLTFLLTL
jgi:serine/threonine protein kinase